MKTANIVVRCEPSFKELVEERATQYPYAHISSDISTYVKYCIQKEMNTATNNSTDTLCSSDDLGDGISFSMPDQLGTVFSVYGDQYELHAKNEKLTDSFLDQLLQADNNAAFTLYSDNETESKTILSFQGDTLTIQKNGFSKTYPVSLEEFRKTFIENVKKYALYYAAPCNYRAFFFKSFDNMIKQFYKYQDAADYILYKIQKFEK